MGVDAAANEPGDATTEESVSPPWAPPPVPGTQSSPATQTVPPSFPPPGSTHAWASDVVADEGPLPNQSRQGPGARPGGHPHRVSRKSLRRSRRRLGAVAVLGFVVVVVAGIAVAARYGAGPRDAAGPVSSLVDETPLGTAVENGDLPWVAEDPVPPELTSPPGTDDGMSGDVLSVSVLDVPTLAESRMDPPRSSLANDWGWSTGQIERVLPVAEGLAVVGAVQDFRQGSVPGVLVYSDDGTAITEVRGLRLEVDGVVSATAVDLIELDDGSWRVFGWEDHTDGKTAVLWRVGADDTVVLEHRFESHDLGGHAQLIEIDSAGRTWLVSTTRGFDGSLDVAVETSAGWVFGSVEAGFVKGVQTAMFGDRLSVWYDAQTVDGQPSTVHAGWLSRSFELEDLGLVASDPVWVPGVVIGDGAWIGDEFVVPGANIITGDSVLLASGDGVTWTPRELPRYRSMWPTAVLASETGTVVLYSSNDEDRTTGFWELQALIETGDGFEPWADPIFVDWFKDPWSNDVLAEMIGHRLAVVDRPWRGYPTFRVAGAGGVEPATVELGFPVNVPRNISRVSELLATADGVVAVVDHLEASDEQWWHDMSEVYVLRDRKWIGVTNAYIAGTTIWRQHALFAIPSTTGTEFYQLDGDDVTVVGSTDLIGSVDAMTAVGDDLFIVADHRGRQQLFNGAVQGSINLTTGLPQDHEVVTLCESTDAVYVVLESMTTGIRSISTVEDSTLINVAQLPDGLADPTGRHRNPLCWTTNDAIAIMTEFDELNGASVPILAWVPRSGPPGTVSIVESYHTPPGSIGVDASPEHFLTNIAGVARDQHGSYDAMWWSTPENGQLVHKTIYGGNGRQEANSILRVDDGWLIGGADNGEPVIWIQPD